MNDAGHFARVTRRWVAAFDALGVPAVPATFTPRVAAVPGAPNDERLAIQLAKNSRGAAVATLECHAGPGLPLLMVQYTLPARTTGLVFRCTRAMPSATLFEETPDGELLQELTLPGFDLDSTRRALLALADEAAALPAPSEIEIGVGVRLCCSVCRAVVCRLECSDRSGMRGPRCATRGVPQYFLDASEGGRVLAGSQAEAMLEAAFAGELAATVAAVGPPAERAFCATCEALYCSAHSNAGRCPAGHVLAR